MPPEETAPQGQAGEATATATEATNGNWFDGLHEDFRVDPSIKTFTETEDGLNKFVESHLNLRKKIGTAIWIPGDKATEQEVYDFRKKLGVPETPDKYDIKYRDHEVIKLNENLDKEWKSLAHKIGLTPKQAQSLVDYEFDRFEKALTNQNEKYKAAEDTLRQELGNGYDDALNRANNVLRNFADDKDLAVLTDPDGRYANDPVLVRFLSKIGSQMGEHTFRQGDGLTSQDAKDDIKKQMLELQLVYMDNSKDKVVRDAANKEYQKLAEKLYGAAEVSSSVGLSFK